MQMESENRGGAVIVRVSGNLDTASAPQMRTCECFAQPAQPVILDMSGLAYIDSSGLGAIVTAVKSVRQAGQSMILVSPSGIVRKVLSVTAIDKILPVVTSLDEALSQLKA